MTGRGGGNIRDSGAAVSTHPYPMVRSGGLFLLLIGCGVIGGTLVPGPAIINRGVFFLGLGAALLSLLTVRLVSFGRGSRRQFTALGAAIAIEVVLIMAAARFIGPQPERLLWCRTLFIVGVHFLPMAISFGPQMLWLGAACMLNATTGWLLPIFPFPVTALVDGSLKAAFGICMLCTRRPAG